jgi:nucleoside-diphosphate-sugar epimerase
LGGSVGAPTAALKRSERPRHLYLKLLLLTGRSAASLLVLFLLSSVEHEVLNSAFPATVVRLGGIYGPGHTRLIDSVRNGTATCTDGPPMYTNRSRRDDCAGVLQYVMQLASPESVYVAVDYDPADQREVYRCLAQQLGVPPPRTASSMAAESRLNRSNKRCRNGKLAAVG